MLHFDEVAFSYPGRGSRKPAVESISFAVEPGQILALIGESGSGKTTISRLAAGLISPSHGCIKRPINSTQMVFQSSSQSLSPHLTVGELVAEGLRLQGVAANTRTSMARECLLKVGLSDAFMSRHSDSLSGGQRQRVNIARAIITEPKLLIADEPVSALDVSVQAQICNLFRPLVSELGCGMLLVIHDLTLARYLADTLVVLQSGRIIEQGDADRIFSAPQQHYTQQLIEAGLVFR